MGMYYDEEGNYKGDKPGRNEDTTGPDMNEEPPSEDDKSEKSENENENKQTGKDIAQAGADLAGQMAAAHRQSWSGYKGGSTAVVDKSKNRQNAQGNLAYSGKQSSPVRELDEDAKRIMRQIDNLDRKTYG